MQPVTSDIDSPMSIESNTNPPKWDSQKREREKQSKIVARLRAKIRVKRRSSVNGIHQKLSVNNQSVSSKREMMEKNSSEGTISKRRRTNEGWNRDHEFFHSKNAIPTFCAKFIYRGQGLETLPWGKSREWIDVIAPRIITVT